ncbi:MAG: restriction endonuclease subunit S [Algoriphagus sp.]|uniref:restriction endonuclease subunit S n=1 Tax=Algoriphagus sp. TaxID=1872435 RepID=UPI002625A490|nr:restriction endonuclease subunit S [Algoriphagus sp.]MDG1276003.1 restriction endonuclease subunit S [Algoriphagus sp.]
MNKENKPALSKVERLIPELRFPEFRNESRWEHKSLSDVCDVTNGKANAQDHIEEGKYPLFDRSEVIKASNEFIFDCEAVIIPGEGMRFIPKYYKGRFNLHQRAYALKDFNCSGLFVYYSMLHRSDLLSQKAVRSTVLSLRLPILQDFPIEIPNKTQEQQKIASCLSSLDELITAHSQKLELLKDHKKGLMQNLFPQEGETVPKVRFKEFENDGEWLEKKLGEVFSIFQGFAFSSDDNATNGTRWLKIADVGIQEMKNDTQSFLPKSFQEQFDKFLVKKGDFVLALTRPILNGQLKIAEVDETFHNALLNQRVGKIVSDNNTSFVYYLLQTAEMVNSINNNIAGNEPPNLSFQQIENILILIPPTTSEQQIIASCLSSLDALITAQAEKIKQLNLHKKGLMQGVFPKIQD